MKSKFDPDNEKIIVDYMKYNGQVKNPFAELSKIIPFKPKQISHHWWNVLDPRIDQDPISDEEKDFIYRWVENAYAQNSMIQWKVLKTEIQNEFGKFRTRNHLKNIWYSKERRLVRIARVGIRRNY
ncbi:1206_t:CDS:2 [Funneliformis mosseae]|uniref:1206_t:CDS:1 n=1 Tax=Funneliformis mosseae TaxID=27381 RepID=A0A9N9NBX6_FUNMO|nr:1206_t:CDS:2 [Funneliformis mosseae]